jgi:phospholipid/cholesterol/gamma-HCH transport system substrate-binding protein
MQAAKHNFLLKGFFNKKAKAAAKTKDSIQSVKDKQQKIQDKKNK